MYFSVRASTGSFSGGGASIRRTTVPSARTTATPSRGASSLPPFASAA